jgi:hypothetical protein
VTLNPDEIPTGIKRKTGITICARLKPTVRRWCPDRLG